MKNKFIILLIFVSSIAHAFNCTDATHTNVGESTPVTEQVCFMQDKDYFISPNCSKLKCDFITKLKTAKTAPDSIHERPGTVICRHLNGRVQWVKFKEKNEETPRCLFEESSSFISLNMLESWNGKSFSGPAESISFK